MIKSEVVQVGVSSRLLVLLNSNTKLTFTAKILLKLFLSNLLHPLKLKAPTMVLSNSTVFKITLIPQWTYFLLVRKIRPFLHEKVVIAQSDACRWFYAPIYAKWLPLTKFQNYLLFEEFLFVHFLKYCVFPFLQSKLHLFFILFIAKKFSLEGNFKYLCLHLDLFIIDF